MQVRRLLSTRVILCGRYCTTIIVIQQKGVNVMSALYKKHQSNQYLIIIVMMQIQTQVTNKNTISTRRKTLKYQKVWGKTYFQYNKVMTILSYSQHVIQFIMTAVELKISLHHSLYLVWKQLPSSYLLQCFQAPVHSQSISQCRGSRISNHIPFKTVKESISELLVLVKKLMEQ